LQLRNNESDSTVWPRASTRASDRQRGGLPIERQQQYIDSTANF